MNDQIYTSILKELIREVLAEPQDGSFVVTSDSSDQFLLKRNGGSPWRKKIGNTMCASVYRVVRSDGDEVDPIQVIKALKEPTQKGNIKVPSGTIDQILDEAVELIGGWYSGENIDFITTPQSSKTLSIRFAKKISEEIHSKFIPSGTVKDLENARISSNLPSSYQPKTIRSLERSLERMKRSKSKDLHTHFRPQDRKFITNWQRIRSGADIKLDTNALIVDDVISDGATMTEMVRTLTEFGVNVVGCITLFRTGS